MKTIKQKILLPFLLLIILIPMVSLTIFNIVINIQVHKTATKELQNTVKTINKLIKNEILNNDSLNNLSEVDSSLSKIKETLKASKLTINTEFLIIGKNGDLIYPRNSSDSFLNDNVIELVSKRVLYYERGVVQNIKVDSKKYLVLREKISKTANEKSGSLVFVSSLSRANDIITIVNIMLFIVMLFFTIISILIANDISNRISKPVKELCKITDKIGDGDFKLSSQQTKIIELFKLEESISSMSKKLNAYDKAQKAFLQNASHELRTPLMSIQGYSEGIELGVLSDTKKAAGIINSESKRLNIIVDQLLMLSRIENQTYGKTLVKINICDILKEYCQTLYGIALKDKKEINLNLPENPIFIMADENLLSQIIINIASNCIRYADKTVGIDLYQEKNKVIIKICDDGKGINEKDLPYIFDRFYRGEKGNTGLGLAIAKSAIGFIDGNLIAYNSDKGAVFEIQFNSI